MDESVVEVLHCLLKVAVDGHSVDSWEKGGGGGDGDRALCGTLPIREVIIEENLERVYGELKLALDGPDKLQLDAAALVLRSKGNQRPLVVPVRDEDHLSHVGLLQQVAADSAGGGLFRKEL